MYLENSFAFSVSEFQVIYTDFFCTVVNFPSRCPFDTSRVIHFDPFACASLDPTDDASVGRCCTVSVRFSKVDIFLSLFSFLLNVVDQSDSKTESNSISTTSSRHRIRPCS